MVALNMPDALMTLFYFPKIKMICNKRIEKGELILVIQKTS